MSDKEINFVTHTCKHCGKAFIEQDNNNSQDVPPTWRYCPECVKNGYRNRVMTKNERHLVKLYDFYKDNNIKDSKIQEISTIEAYKIVNRVLEDCTIVEGKGKYTHTDGTITTEATLIVTVFDFDNKFNIKDACDKLKLILNQEAIAVSVENIDSQLY